jgi:hypothetical protein
MTEKDGRLWLFTRMRPDIQIKIIAFSVLFGGIFIAGSIWGKLEGEALLEMYKNIAIMLMICVIGISILIYSNKTYKISYDDDSVYMGGTKWSWRKFRDVRTEVSMRFDEIAELGAAQTPGVTPFTYIAFLRCGGEWEERFYVSRLQLRDDEMKELFRHMYAKIPEKFPPELIEFIQ